MAQGQKFYYPKEGKTVIIFQAGKSRSAQKAKKFLGWTLISFSLACFLLFLSPILASRLAGQTKLNNREKVVAQEIKPVKQNFLLSIAKIGLKNAQVVRQVDVDNKDEYKKALLQGLAHAKGSAYPGQGKMVYIFGHSTNYPWFIKDLNALFFKLETLKVNDRIEVEFNGKKYFYFVIDKKVINPKEVDQVLAYQNKDVLILQTCTPPGTFLKRLLIIAKPNKMAGLISYNLN